MDGDLLPEVEGSLVQEVETKEVIVKIEGERDSSLSSDSVDSEEVVVVASERKAVGGFVIDLLTESDTECNGGHGSDGVECSEEVVVIVSKRKTGGGVLINLVTDDDSGSNNDGELDVKEDLGHVSSGGVDCDDDDSIFSDSNGDDDEGDDCDDNGEVSEDDEVAGEFDDFIDNNDEYDADHDDDDDDEDDGGVYDNPDGTGSCDDEFSDDTTHSLVFK